MIIEPAELYDLLYSFKDYEKESQEIMATLQKLVPNCQSILDVGCGTSEHHKYLKAAYQMHGIDINPDYLDAARKKNPTGSYQVKDMVDFDLNQSYDVILCLFSAIGFAKTYPSLVSALKSFYRHLEEDGVLIVEPWLTPEKTTNGHIGLLTHENDTYHISRMNDVIVEGKISTLNFHYLVGKLGEEVVYFKEVLELGLYTMEEMKQAFQDAGFKVDYAQDGLTGRGVYFGRK